MTSSFYAPHNTPASYRRHIPDGVVYEYQTDLDALSVRSNSRGRSVERSAAGGCTPRGNSNGPSGLAGSSVEGSVGGDRGFDDQSVETVPVRTPLTYQSDSIHERDFMPFTTDGYFCFGVKKIAEVDGHSDCYIEAEKRKRRNGGHAATTARSVPSTPYHEMAKAGSSDRAPAQTPRAQPVDVVAASDVTKVATISSNEMPPVEPAPVQEVSVPVQEVSVPVVEEVSPMDETTPVPIAKEEIPEPVTADQVVEPIVVPVIVESIPEPVVEVVPEVVAPPPPAVEEEVTDVSKATTKSKSKAKAKTKSPAATEVSMTSGATAKSKAKGKAKSKAQA